MTSSYTYYCHEGKKVFIRESKAIEFSEDFFLCSSVCFSFFVSLLVCLFVFGWVSDLF